MGFVVNKVAQRGFAASTSFFRVVYSTPLIHIRRPSKVCTVAMVDVAVTQGQPESVS